MEAGASLAINGCCLTLREDADAEVSFDLLEETLDRTNLGKLSKGDSLNLERALKASDRLGGHFVTGHIDAVGEIQIFENRGKNLFLQIGIPEEYSRYLVDKGCISVDGCSLTVCEVHSMSFAVWLIPHTLEKTNLMEKNVGSDLNLEFDLLAKYVERLSLSSLRED